MLPDLPAFRDLLFAYAKEVWRGYNTERQRVPKGFDKCLSFDLIAIEDGSAKPKVGLGQAGCSGLPAWIYG